MRSLKALVLVISLIVFSCNILSAEESDLKITAQAVTENVYAITAPSIGLPTPENQGWNSNSYFIVTDKGVLVFDTGSSLVIGKAIKKAIKDVTDKPVRWVVNSHSHADHWLGNSAFEEKEVKIISSKSAIKLMENDADFVLGAFSKMTNGATDGTTAVYPTKLLTHGKAMKLGGVDIEFIFSGDAHSPGDILLWLPKQKAIFGGDVLSSNWMPIITPHANVPNLIMTLKNVSRLNPSFVLPGHGKVTDKQSIFRDKKLLKKISKLIKEGKGKNLAFEEIQKSALEVLSEEFRPLYDDFDTKINEMVNQIYKLT